MDVVVRPPVPELAPKRASTTVALFSDLSCAPCVQLVPVFEALAKDFDDLEFAIVLAGQGNGAKSPRVEMLEDRQALFDLLGIPVTPFALAVDATGLVRESSPVGSASTLEAFVRHAGNEGGEE
jgi:thiol-disulfide isomerase/thioredoxin